MKTKILLLALLAFAMNAKAQWVQTSLDSVVIDCFATKGADIFAGDYDGYGAYMSSDSGLTWTLINNGFAYMMFHHSYIDCLSVSGNKIYAGAHEPSTDHADLFISNNNGSNWSASSLGSYTTIVDVVVALITKGNIILAGLENEGIFFSNDTGATWSKRNNGLSDTLIRSLAETGNKIFAGTRINGMFLSKDTASNWTQVTTGIPTNNYVRRIVANGRYIYACTNSSGIYLSKDTGTTWAAMNTGLTCDTILSIAVKDSEIFVGTITGGVFYSNNNCSSWTAINYGLPYYCVPALLVFGNYIFACIDTVGRSGIPNGFGVWKRSISELNGIKKINNNKTHVAIYPNPATDNLTIDVSATLNIPATIEITNIQGQLIETLATTGNKTNIDVSSLAKGMYFVKVKMENGVESRKFVKL